MGLWNWITKPRSDREVRSEWGLLMSALGDRLVGPLVQPAYIFFFVVSMAIGATGIWVSLAEAWLVSQSATIPTSVWADPSVSKSILTFFAALGSLSCIQVVVIEDRQKSLRSLVCLLLVTFIMLAIVAAVLESQTSGDGYPYLIAGTVLSIVTWWMANWDDEKYSQLSSLEPLGGDSDGEVAGNTDGFTT